MASMGRIDPEPALRLVRGQGMLNKILSAICRAENLPVAGNKAELQSRISDNLRKYADKNDHHSFMRLKGMLERPDQIHQSPPSTVRTGVYQNGQHQATPPSMNGRGYAPVMGAGNFAYNGPQLTFKHSPFYTIVKQLGATKHCDVMQQHRHTVSIQIRTLDDQMLDEVLADQEKALRIMAFCASDIGFQEQDISFPHQSEIKVNGGEVKANLRGLKNKPGSTKPVDVTDQLRLRPAAYTNNVEMTYALTTKKFYFAVYVVRVTPVAELVKVLENGKRITKDSILREMVAKAQDPDIVTTSTVLSLKCPLSGSRMGIPSRSMACRHNQCFDASWYLELQQQGPTWLCPICNTAAPFENLAIDEYLKDILKNTSSSTEQVTVEPDGKWSTTGKVDTSGNNKHSNDCESDDDDLVEITDSRVASLKQEIKTAYSPSTTATTNTQTPPAPSRETSTASSVPPRGPSSKRPISQVIDLTISDDDDDEPLMRAPKRQNTSNFSTPTSMYPLRSPYGT